MASSASFPAAFGRISIAAGSVVNFKGSAIVNAANEIGVTGGGVDGAINQRGGTALLEARRALPIIKGSDTRILTGGAATTIAGDLDVTWVIHAVGPNYNILEHEEVGDELLFRAYRSAMQQARAKSAATVGFSLLSAGIFRGMRTLTEVLKIGLLAVEANAYPGLEEVFLVGFTEREKNTLLELSEALFDPTDGELARQEALEDECEAVRTLYQRSLSERAQLEEQREVPREETAGADDSK